MAHEQRPRPPVVASDVVGTLFSLDPVGRRLSDAGLREGALNEWFGRFLRDAFAFDRAGLYVPFRDVARETLEVMLAEQGQGPEKAAGVLQAFAELPAHPDVRPAFEQLRGASRAGLTTGWVSREEKLFHPSMAEPTVHGGTLPQAVAGLLALKA